MKKIKIILPIIIVITIIILIIINTKKDTPSSEVEQVSIPEYQSDMKCTKTENMENTSGDEVEYTSNIYLNLNDNYVTTAVIQSVEVGTSMADADVSLMEPIIEDYNNLKGVNASIKIIGNYIVTTVTYNYEEIDLSEIRTELSSLLTDDSIFNKVEEFPITLEEYQEYMLDGYTCN